MSENPTRVFQARSEIESEEKGISLEIKDFVEKVTAVLGEREVRACLYGQLKRRHSYNIQKIDRLKCEGLPPFLTEDQNRVVELVVMELVGEVQLQAPHAQRDNYTRNNPELGQKQRSQRRFGDKA